MFYSTSDITLQLVDLINLLYLSRKIYSWFKQHNINGQHGNSGPMTPALSQLFVMFTVCLDSSRFKRYSIYSRLFLMRIERNHVHSVLQTVLQSHGAVLGAGLHSVSRLFVTLSEQ